MIKVFQEISALLEDSRKPLVEGWCRVEKAFAMAATVFGLRPKVSIELGVWAGRSLLPVALALKEAGCGYIVGIDPFSPVASAEGYDPKNRDWWLHAANHEYALNQLNGLICELGVQNVVKFVRTTSDAYALDGDTVIDLLHIDGVHTFQARKDVNKYAPRVRVGGIVFVDDPSWEVEGTAHVRLATEDLLALGFVKLYGIFGQGNDAEVFQRIK
jgi:Methyltransferase domain